MNINRIAIITILSLILINISLFDNINDIAQATSNSNGNNIKREINSGLDLVGRSKTEVIQLIGRPKTKDKSPSKSRYNEKWTYSCEDKNGAKQNCVYLYFGADRVKKVEVN
jgi:hypothetical protein